MLAALVVVPHHDCDDICSDILAMGTSSRHGAHLFGRSLLGPLHPIDGGDVCRVVSLVLFASWCLWSVFGDTFGPHRGRAVTSHGRSGLCRSWGCGVPPPLLCDM